MESCIAHFFFWMKIIFKKKVENRKYSPKYCSTMENSAMNIIIPPFVDHTQKIFFIAPIDQGRYKKKAYLCFWTKNTKISIHNRPIMSDFSSFFGNIFCSSQNMKKEKNVKLFFTFSPQRFFWSSQYSSF